MQHRYGSMVVRGSKIRYLDRQMDVDELGEIFEKYRPDMLVIMGADECLTATTLTCLHFALQYEVPIVARDPGAKAALISWLGLD